MYSRHRTLIAAPKRVRAAPHASAKARAKRYSRLPGLGARGAPHASRQSAREALRPPARKYVELKVLARSDHDLRMRLGPREPARPGACRLSGRVGCEAPGQSRPG